MIKENNKIETTNNGEKLSLNRNKIKTKSTAASKGILVGDNKGILVGDSKGIIIGG